MTITTSTSLRHTIDPSGGARGMSRQDTFLDAIQLDMTQAVFAPSASARWLGIAQALEARAPSCAKARQDAQDTAIVAALATRLQDLTLRARFLDPTHADARQARAEARVSWHRAPFGVMRAAMTGKVLLRCDFFDKPDGALDDDPNHPALAMFHAEALEAWFIGTKHQRAVWRGLLDIPFGETITYGVLAKRVGSSPRAVGSLGVGRNPISWLAPCHRVVGASGALTGFGGGLTRKRAMLALENRLAD